MTPHAITQNSPRYYYLGGALQSASSGYGHSSWLSCPTSNNGNFKDPTAYEYLLTERRWPTGRRFVQRWSSPSSKYQSQEWIGNMVAELPPYPDVPGFDFSGLSDIAIGKLFNKIRGQGNLAVDALEARQTGQMLKSTSTLRGIAMQFRTATRGWSKGRAASRALRGLTDRWLEYRYGWQPVINSIYATAEQLMRENSQRVIPITVRAGRETNLSEARDFSDLATFSKGLAISARKSERYIMSCNFYLPDTTDLANFTSLNPVSIAWELVPYSFVVDWVYSVGGYLQNLESYWLYRSGFHSGYYTESGLYEGTAKWNGAFGANYAYDSSLSTNIIEAAGSARARRLRRVILYELPVPGRPRFKLALGAKQMLDAAALLRTILVK